MKIYQLFNQKVGLELLLKLLLCFGIRHLQDTHAFSKYDMIKTQTVSKLEAIKDELMACYLPCKARVYLTDLNEKKALTVLKQVLRLHGYYLQSREKNLNHRKVIYYRISSETERNEPNPSMKHTYGSSVIHFD